LLVSTITNFVTDKRIYLDYFCKRSIEGATAILPSIKGIKLELSLVPLYKGQVLFKEMIDIVEKLGYELYGIEPGFTAEKTGRMLQMDGIFFKPD
jgi:hypothetical protein